MADRSEDVTIVHRIPAGMRAAAAELYDEAFGPKLAAAGLRRAVRLAVLHDGIDLGFALGAICEGRLVGLAGYQTAGGGFTSGIDHRLLVRHSGRLVGTWAAAVLSLYRRAASGRHLVMDGIVVSAHARGRGVGSRLLHAVAALAKADRFESVRLDVIDTNPGARRLYERHGFVATRTERFPMLRWLLGFGASTTMERRVARPA